LKVIPATLSKGRDSVFADARLCTRRKNNLGELLATRELDQHRAPDLLNLLLLIRHVEKLRD